MLSNGYPLPYGIALFLPQCPTLRETEELSNIWEIHVPSMYLMILTYKNACVLQYLCKVGQQNRQAIKENLHLDKGLQVAVLHYLPSSSMNKADLSTFLVHRWHINSCYKSTVFCVAGFCFLLKFL